MSEFLLNIANLNAFYGKSNVLQDVNLTVQTGELVLVVGRNGMGKTTLMRSILGYPPVKRKGRIVFDNLEISGWEPHRIAAQGVGYVPQGRQLFPSLTVEEHLRLSAGRSLDSESAWTFAAVYDLFPELKKRARISGTLLSGGEQQMLAIARALLTNPRLLLMDEPSEGLSQSVIKKVEQVCRRLSSEGIAILLVEQNLDMAANLADRVYVFLNGTIVLEEDGNAFRTDRTQIGSYLGV